MLDLREPRNFAGENLSYDGENMDNYEVSHATGDSYLEMEQRLASLRSLVCDLLKTNQELRQILLEAGID